MKVSLAMLLKTLVEKMPENLSLAMLMKPNKLKSLSGDVDERERDKDVKSTHQFIGASTHRLTTGLVLDDPVRQ